MSNLESLFENTFKTPPYPYWVASTSKTRYPSLEEDIQADIVIVGGGITGITCAYLLKQEGIKVVIIDADRIIRGTTGHTTAKITSQHGLIYNKLKQKHGENTAKVYAEANEYAVKFISNLVNDLNVDCDFAHQSSYVYTLSDNYIKDIEDEARIASDLGINAHLTRETPLPFKVKAAVYFENQAQFHPRKYLLKLVEKIEGDGSYIFENTRIMDIKEGEPATLITDRGNKITAKTVIITSHYPCYDGRGMYFTRLYPERSYGLGVKIKGKYHGGMFISAEDPARSVRSTRFEDEELLIISGEHHKSGQDDNTRKHYENLIGFSVSSYDVLEIPYRWSTQDYSTPDEMPYIGHLTSHSPNIYVATGYKKWGMTTSTVASIIIRDLIIRGENPWAEIYSPSRFTPEASATKIIKENANVAKELIKGKLSIPPDNVNLKNGEGKIIDVDGQRAGAYRDEKGVLHIVDSTCTHMGCELNWNNAEKTWDCPCHGSRFTPEGKIVEGPAVHCLKHITDGKNEIDPNIF